MLALAMGALATQQAMVNAMAPVTACITPMVVVAGPVVVRAVALVAGTRAVVTAARTHRSTRRSAMCVTAAVHLAVAPAARRAPVTITRSGR